MEIKRIFDLLPHLLENYPDLEVALAGKQNGNWITYSSQKYVECSNALSGALIELGIKPGEKVAIICGNRPEWNMMDMAVTQIGAILVPIYPTITEQDYQFILTNCEARFCILDGNSVLNKIEAVRDRTQLEMVYTFSDKGKYPYFDSLMELGREHPHTEEIKKRSAAVDEKDCATIIYTSGTTGVPKGVMLSHYNLVNQYKNFYHIPSPNNKVAFSFLPICHAYERALIYMYQYCGMSIYYAESLATLNDNMREIHPNMFCAVPRILEKFYEKIYSSGKSMKWPVKGMFYWAIKLAERYRIDPKTRTWTYNLKLWLMDKLFYSKIREKLGGENIDIIVTGAASVTQRICSFFCAIKMNVFEGYGLTETSPVISVSTRDPYGREVDCVGPPLRGVEVKIAENGEVLCRGHNVMMGYYKNPELTAEVIDSEGWFHTGDLGRFNEHGLLQITGRLKNLFKTSLGKYINPEVIEHLYEKSGFVENVIVVGESQKFPAAIIHPNFSFLRTWCSRHEIKFTTPEEMIKNEQVLKRYFAEVKKLNENLGEVEKIKKYVLVADDWTIANGFLTPTLKVRRKVVMERYRELIEEMFK